MEVIAQNLTDYCIKNHIADPEDSEWLLYCIEKRLISLAGMLTMTILAAFLSGSSAELLF